MTLHIGVVACSAEGAAQAVIQSLKAKACDAVILGYTEIPLVIDDSNSALPTF